MSKRKALDEMAKKMRPPAKWILIGVSMFLVGMFVSFTLAYWITNWVYRTWFPDFALTMAGQYVTFGCTFIVLFSLMNATRYLFNPAKRQFTLFVDLLDAMGRMAKGDFNVKLVADKRNTQFRVLVTGFNEMATHLSQMERMRQEFISNVSHEFQSPLTSIGGFARALQSDDLHRETRLHYLQIIETECSRLSKLSDHLLKLTSLESNRHPFEPRPYRLDRQIRSAVLICEPQWKARKLEMDVELQETMITADEDLLNQVWHNLLHNAIKYTPESGTITVKLTSAPDHPAGSIRVEVSDTGIGVSSEDLPYLFERFFKADKARSRAEGGSGLGLSIVKKIIDLHGGEITVESRPSEGTAFTVFLPKEAVRGADPVSNAH